MGRRMLCGWCAVTLENAVHVRPFCVDASLLGERGMVFCTWESDVCFWGEGVTLCAWGGKNRTVHWSCVFVCIDCLLLSLSCVSDDVSGMCLQGLPSIRCVGEDGQVQRTGVIAWEMEEDIPREETCVGVANTRKLRRAYLITSVLLLTSLSH